MLRSPRPPPKTQPRRLSSRRPPQLTRLPATEPNSSRSRPAPKLLVSVVAEAVVRVAVAAVKVVELAVAKEVSAVANAEAVVVIEVAVAVTEAAVAENAEIAEVAVTENVEAVVTESAEAVVMERAVDVAVPELLSSKAKRVNAARDSHVSVSLAKKVPRRQTVLAEAADVVAVTIKMASAATTTTEDLARTVSKRTVSQERREKLSGNPSPSLRKKSRKLATLLMTTLRTSLLNPLVLLLVPRR